jgi:hypothetical protein
LTELRAANPATSERVRLERERSRTAKAIQRLVNAYKKDLITFADTARLGHKICFRVALVT